jgi:acetyl-CoA acyltransferase
MREAVIVEAVRTPIGRRNGKLKDVHPVVLASLVLREVVRRAGIDPAQVEDVVFGCVGQAGEQSLNIGRNA